MSPVLTQHVSQPITLDEQTQKMKRHLLQDIRRSAYVYRVDCGGCNACEIEIFAAITPVFDAERFGIKVVSSPRHADILLFTGAVTRAMRMPALRAYESAPDHKICVSYGACGVGGGIFHDLYSVWGGSDTIVPIDVWIPGCPPTPYRHHSRFRRGARFAATEDSRGGLSRSHRGDYATVVAADPAITAYRH